MDSRCSKCNKQKQCFDCDGCSRKICKQCGDLTSSETKCLELKEKRVLIFHCPTCKDNEPVKLCKEIIEHKQKIIDDKEKIIKLLEDEIGNLKKNQLPTNLPKSYADSIKSGTSSQTRKETIPTLIIKPKQKQDVKITERDIKNSVNPSELKVGIKSVKSTKNGLMVIKCESKQELDKLCEDAKKKMKNYEISLPKLRKPRIKIAGYKGNLNNDEIEADIRKQNNWINEEDILKITYQRTNIQKQTKTILAECSPNLFHKFMDYKKIYLNWERLSVYEDLTITKCFNCQGFHHKSNSCEKKQICFICSDEHDGKDCKNPQKKCINCVTANLRYNTKYDHNHAANDDNCPSYKYQIEALQNKIDYGS